MKKVICIALALLMMVGLFAGCQQAQETQQPQQDAQQTTTATETETAPAAETVKFAVLAPITGNYAEFGKAFDQADVTAYMDKVVTAADASNTTVQKMMEGVSKIGAAGRLFAGGDSELLAFLGMLANLNR